jgi:hypothetical protein
VVWAIRATSAARTYGGEAADALSARDAIGTRLREHVEAGASSSHPAAVAVEQDRPADTIADGLVDSAPDRGRERDQGQLGAFAEHAQDPVAVLLTQVVDLGVARPEHWGCCTGKCHVRVIRQWTRCCWPLWPSCSREICAVLLEGLGEPVPGDGPGSRTASADAAAP